MFAAYLNAHSLHELLGQPGDYRPFPRRQARGAWNDLPESRRAQILAWADEAKQGYPMVTATQFLAFCRTGDRMAYEKPYFTRRNRLMGAALGECLLDDGTYLDAIIDGLWCICEETTWVLSAHNGSDHPGRPPMNERPLPDENNPYVDLFAAQTAAALADILYLLEDKLDAVSPLIARRVRQEIDRRVLTPFMQHDDFWWMGMIRKDVCNWTPWILSNVIDTLLLLERDNWRRSEGVTRAMRMLDSYLAVLPEDGGCDEGAGYFNMAGAALFDALESVYQATNGRVSFYDEPMIRRIAAFPMHAHIAGAYFVNFADCDAKPKLDGQRIALFGRRTGQPDLERFGLWLEGQKTSVRPVDTPQMSRVLQNLFAGNGQADEPKGEAFSALPSLQVFAWRKGGLYAAIKGGHNGESHNHNDIGSFIVYADGEPEIIDVGNCVYTAQTFGPRRYELMNTRSKNHNVPLIGETEQAAGHEYRARDVAADENGARMELAGAYPEEAGVRSLARTLTVSEDELELTDEVTLDAEKPVTFVFMLRHRPTVQNGQAHFGKLRMTFDASLDVRVEEIHVTDARMVKNFPGSVWRMTMTSGEAKEHRQIFALKRTPSVPSGHLPQGGRLEV